MPHDRNCLATNEIFVLTLSEPSRSGGKQGYSSCLKSDGFIYICVMMEDYGFLRVAAASPRVKVADVDYNADAICRQIAEAEARQVSLLVFPELSLTGCSCADLFGQNLLLTGAERAVARIAQFARGKGVTVVTGAPVRFQDRLYNCAVVIRNGGVKGLVPKVYLPACNEFYEERWFASGADFLAPAASFGPLTDDGKNFFREGFGGCIQYAGVRCNISPNLLFRISHATVGIEICEDLWTPVPPSSHLALAGAEVIVNISASNELLMKNLYRKSLVANQSARTISGYVYCSCGFGESTQDLVFAGSSLICENGALLCENERFGFEDSWIVADLDIEKLAVLRQKENSFKSIAPDGTVSSDYSRLFARFDLGPAVPSDFEKQLFRQVEPHPFVPDGDPGEIDRRAREIISIQVTGLATRMEHIGCKHAILGISGGLDSTLALLVTVLAFDKLGFPRDGIIGVTMPGFGTTDRTHSNAVDLMRALGVSAREISIVPAVLQHFADIGQDSGVHDVTYENSQARERTQILMDIANKEGGIVVGTGDLSELALGWCTYNGDHMSMYAVNVSIPKTLVKYLVGWAALHFFGADKPHESSGRSAKDILLDVVDTPISPELTPPDEKGNFVQKTEDLVGPYELHDFFLYHFFRFGCSPRKLYFLARKAFLGESADSAGVFIGPEGRANEYDEATLLKWLKKFYWRFFSQQFKRSCLPDGPKVGSVSLSPRGDWRMPSDAKAQLFLSELEKI